MTAGENVNVQVVYRLPAVRPGVDYQPESVAAARPTESRRNVEQFGNQRAVAAV